MFVEPRASSNVLTALFSFLGSSTLVIALGYASSGQLHILLKVILKDSTLNPLTHTDNPSEYMTMEVLTPRPILYYENKLVTIRALS